MKKLSVLALGVVCLAVFYWLLKASTATMRPMGLGNIVALMVLGAIGLLTSFEALGGLYGACCNRLAEIKNQRRLRNVLRKEALRVRGIKDANFKRYFQAL